MIITKTVDELLSEMKTTKQKLELDNNPVSTLIDDAMNMINTLFAYSNLKQYRAFVKNENTNKTYNLIIFAENKNKADRQIYDIFDNFFYNKETNEQDMYSHTIEEINSKENFMNIQESDSDEVPF